VSGSAVHAACLMLSALKGQAMCWPGAVISSPSTSIVAMMYGRLC